MNLLDRKHGLAASMLALLATAPLAAQEMNFPMVACDPYAASSGAATCGAEIAPATCGVEYQGCDQFGCGPEGMPGPCPECGSFGNGVGNRFGAGCGFCTADGCGPLGCNGGTFGDGRSLKQLLQCITGQFCGSLSGLLMPYGEGGVASQRWFDISAETIVLKREIGASSRNFSSLGSNPVLPTDFVLSSDNVDFDDYEAGLALQGNFQVGPGSNVELVYFGLNEWETSAAAFAPLPVTQNSPLLFSFFSDFGVSPPGGFDDPDRSLSHRIRYESSLNNGEVNLRRRWAEPAGFLQGSWLIGVRHFQLSELFDFEARGENNNGTNNGPRFFDYETKTRNQLTGFQLGTDLWLNVIPGIKIGTEIKGGVFGNRSSQDTRIFANSLPGLGIPAIVESASDGKTAYLAQFSAQAVYRLTYSWALRGSYQMIYVDNVALAPDNVNDQPPAIFLPNSARTVAVNNEADILYTGFTAGAEYTW